MARRYSEGEILGALEGLVREGRGDLSLTEFTRATGISGHAVYRHFGSWPALRKAAGLAGRKRRQPVISDEELLEEYHRVTVRLRRKPSLRLFDALSAFGSGTLTARFGGEAGLAGAYFRYVVIAELRRRLGDLEEWRNVDYRRPVPAGVMEAVARGRMPRFCASETSEREASGAGMSVGEGAPQP